MNGKGKDAGRADDIVRRTGPQGADLRDQLAIVEKLVALLDGRQLQDQRLRVCRSAKTKSEPGKLRALGIALFGPIGCRLQGWPRGIVEVWLGPEGIVA